MMGLGDCVAMCVCVSTGLVVDGSANLVEGRFEDPA